MDDLTLLRCHIDWGADEALQATPRDRLIQPAQRRVDPAPAFVAQPSPPSVRPMPLGAIAVAQAAAAAAATLDDLRAALAGFSDCPLQATAMHMAFADGNPAAGLMLIGDTPGEDEDRSGRPFSGPGGQLLDRMLASIGLDRTSVLLTYAVPWRPPGNRKPTEHERAVCLPFLRRHIALARPRRLVLLGTPVAASLLGGATASLRRLRGQWQAISIEGIKSSIAALPTHAPEQLLATPAAKQTAWTDLLTLRMALNEDCNPAMLT